MVLEGCNYFTSTHFAWLARPGANAQHLAYQSGSPEPVRHQSGKFGAFWRFWPHQSGQSNSPETGFPDYPPVRKSEFPAGLPSRYVCFVVKGRYPFKTNYSTGRTPHMIGLSFLSGGVGVAVGVTAVCAKLAWILNLTWCGGITLPKSYCCCSSKGAKPLRWGRGIHPPSLQGQLLLRLCSC